MRALAQGRARLTVAGGLDRDTLDLDRLQGADPMHRTKAVRLSKSAATAVYRQYGTRRTSRNGM